MQEQKEVNVYLTYICKHLEVIIYIYNILKLEMSDIATDVVKNEIKKGRIQEILYIDDIILIVETMKKNLQQLYSWKSALE